MVISVLRCSLPGSARRFLGTRSPRISRSAAKSGAPFLTTRFFLIVRAPGLAAPSPGGGITPWSGCGAGGGRRRETRGLAGTRRRAGPGHRSRRTRRRLWADRSCPAPRGPRWPSSSDGAASCAEPVRLMVRPAVCGRASPIRRTPEPADGCIRGITGRVPGGCGRGGSTIVRVSGFCSRAGARSGLAARSSASVLPASILPASVLPPRLCCFGTDGFGCAHVVLDRIVLYRYPFRLRRRATPRPGSAIGCSALAAAPLGAACALGASAGCSAAGAVCGAAVSGARARWFRLIVEHGGSLGLRRLAALFEKWRDESVFALPSSFEMERLVGFGRRRGRIRLRARYGAGASRSR